MAWLVWDYFWYPTESWTPSVTYNKGTNGLWLRYWWYFGKRTPAVREKMIDEAKWLVNECGFDGIQWDYEYVRVGSKALPELLDATRRALPPGTPISVDAPVWCPPSPVCWSEASCFPAPTPG